MHSRSPLRKWARRALFALLLLFSLLAPLWWTGTFSNPPRRVQPVDGFSVEPVPYRTTPAAQSDTDTELLVEAPALLPVDREHAHGLADLATQSNVIDTLAEQKSSDRAHSYIANNEGREADFGPFFADQFNPDGEVLPPMAPQVALRDDLQLARVANRLAMRLNMDNRNRQQHVATVWPRPHALVDSLQSIAGNARSERWASEVLQELAALTDVPSIESQESKTRLNKLDELAREVDGFVRRIRPVQQLELVRSTRDALQRRVRIWQQVQALAVRDEPTQFVTSQSQRELLLQSRRALATIPGRKAPTAWKAYLGLDQLEQAIAEGPVDVYERAAIAGFVLDRLNSLRLDERQRDLINNTEFRRLQRILRQAATQPMNNMDVLFAIEQYERSRTPTDGERVALLTNKLRWSTDTEVAELARRIESDYRSSNARLAITEEYFNRLLPASEKKTEAVDEQILNAWVAGEREVETQVSVKLIPDADNWRLTMNADGQMASDTTSYAGNASLFTQGSGTFSASKMIYADRHRVHVYPAKAEASYHGDLCGACTSMESIPILSRIARSTAAENYYESRWAAHREIEEKLQKRAASRLDTQAREQLAEADARITERVLLPLQRTSVEAIPLQMATTKKRIVGEYRLAGTTQLGGHTARPWAPENALLSMQIHETAINNVIAGLQLDGRQGHIRELFPEIYGVFGRDDYQIPDSMPEDVTVLFAEEDAVRISFQDGRMEVILQLAELRTDRRVWRDLVVRNFYAPDTSSLEAKLVRDSTVRLRGERLGTRDQIALRGIFTKIFGENREFPVIPSDLVDGAGLDGLAITQFLIRDGWLGVAIAPPHRGLPIDDSGVREARRADVIFE